MRCLFTQTKQFAKKDTAAKPKTKKTPTIPTSPTILPARVAPPIRSVRFSNCEGNGKKDS